MTVRITKPGQFQSELERRLRAKISAYDPKDPRLKEGLLRIGFLLESQIKLNIRRKRIIDTGRLFNSIRHELYKRGSVVGVQAGSFGVPYAAIHEFGGTMTSRMRRAMFWSLRQSGRLGRVRTSKGIVQGNTFMARPYVRPAVRTHRDRIINIIRDMIQGTR